jgi:hypothetical protein
MAIQLIGAVSNVAADIDPNTRSLKATLKPTDPGALGSYSVCVKSGIMAAGLAAASPILAFLWKPATVPTSFALIRRIKFGMYNLGTGFAAGDILFDFLIARAFTVQDTGGAAVTLTTNNAKLRTSYATTQAAIQASATATLTAGTRTLDANPFRSLFTVVANSAFATSLNDTEVFRQQPGEQPLVLAGSGEGFVIQATVPATGTWTFGCSIDWDEVAAW